MVSWEKGECMSVSSTQFLSCWPLWFLKYVALGHMLWLTGIQIALRGRDINIHIVSVKKIQNVCGEFGFGHVHKVFCLPVYPISV